MEKALQLLPLIRGIDPNLAAGQRSLYCPGDSVYQMVTIPHNDFYLLQNRPFTLFLRVLNLGHNTDYGYQLFAKSADGNGWELIINQSPGDFNQYVAFRCRTGGAIAAVYQDYLPYINQGQFESFVITRAQPLSGDINDPANIRLFRNGVEVPPARMGKGGYISDGYTGLEIGGVNFNFMRGYIDAASFYSVGLTEDEIRGLDNPATRTDRQAKFIFEFNQLSGNVARDLTSVGQNGTILYFPQQGTNKFEGRGFVKTEGIRSFRKNCVLDTPLNGPFTPPAREAVIGLYRYDADLTACQVSYDGVNYTPVTFDGNGRSVNFTPMIVGPQEVNTTIYLRASNANVSFLNAVELIY